MGICHYFSCHISWRGGGGRAILDNVTKSAVFFIEVVPNNIGLFLANDFYFNFFQNLNQKKFLAADFCVNFNRI